MIVLGSAVRGDLDLETDIVVAGSGAGGAVLAKELAEAGHRVVLLEEGGYHTAEDFTQDEREMYPRLYKDRGTQATEDQALTVLQGRCVGGSTVVNYLDCFRTPERLLERWRREAGLTELTLARLDPLWLQVEETLHVRKIGLADLNANNRKLYEGSRALGWKGDTFHRNASGCIGSGYCDLGCTYDAKQSMLLTYVPLASNAGAAIHANCKAHRILWEGDRAVGLEGDVLDPTTDAPRHRFRVRARLVVVSCGSINTPVLLQRSGVLDPSGQIGRNLHLHPAWPVVAEFDDPIVPNVGIKQGYYVSEFSWVLEGHDDDVLLEGISGPPGLTAPIFPGQGDEHRSWIGRRDHLATAIVLLRDHGGGEVALDRNGRTRIRYQVDEALDLPRGRRGIENLMKAFLAAGARRVLASSSRTLEARTPGECEAVRTVPLGPNECALFSAHQMSTCRMGADDRQYPVNPDGLLVAHPNVLVCDASIFPTASGVNPQMTVYGLAMHLADKVRSQPARYGL